MPLNNLQALLGNLGGGLLQKQASGIITPTRSQTQAPFKKHLRIEDGDAAYDTMAEVLAIIGALAAGSEWTKVWEKTVPAQQMMRWGFGSPAYPANQGYMHFCSIDEGANFQIGVVRLVQCNAQETESFTVIEIDDSRLHGTDSTTLITATPTNREEMVPLPEKMEFKKVGEDSKLQVWYKCITVATAEDNVGFSIPVTIYQ